MAVLSNFEALTPIVSKNENHSKQKNSNLSGRSISQTSQEVGQILKSFAKNSFCERGYLQVQEKISVHGTPSGNLILLGFFLSVNKAGECQDSQDVRTARVC